MISMCKYCNKEYVNTEEHKYEKYFCSDVCYNAWKKQYNKEFVGRLSYIDKVKYYAKVRKELLEK